MHITFVFFTLIFRPNSLLTLFRFCHDPYNHFDRVPMYLGVYTVRSSESDQPVGPTQAMSDCLSDQSDKPVGQTIAEPPTSVNQINVAC